VRIALPAEEARDFFAGPPDWIVDATGRARTIARLLDLPARSGTRRDTALFAHCAGVRIEHAGHVHMDHLQSGWCWRIPLPGVVSLGIVAPPATLAACGSDSDSQYDTLLATEPHLRDIAGAARRVSRVGRYSNYQLITERGVGDGWVLAGDALGFVDPIFSSGLFLAIDGARALARALRDGSEGAMRRYERRQRRHLAAWQRLASHYYDGRLFQLVRQSRPEHHGWFGRITHRHVTRNVTRILTGESTTALYAPRLLTFLIRHGIREADREAMQIR
jgi:flavin-dependent dehydrogenase